MSATTTIAAILAEHRRQGIACVCMGWNARLDTGRPVWSIIEQHDVHLAEILARALHDAEQAAS